MNRHETEVRILRRRRPRSRFLRISFALIGLLVICSWFCGDFSTADLASPRRLQNFQRFIGDATPYPLQQGESGILAVWHWAQKSCTEVGLEAMATTLAIALAAIVLAGIAAILFSLPASRMIASPDPYVSSETAVSWYHRWPWAVMVTATRAMLLFARSIPEYIWGFLFLAMLGPGAWAAVLALAVHNAGILAKLGAEVVDDVEPSVPRALRSLGSSRLQMVTVGVFPMVLPRFFLYFFYRWETCIRESVVLGLLGISSLGYWIQDARVRDRYDDMILFILIGAMLVLAGDLVSTMTRRIVRRAS